VDSTLLTLLLDLTLSAYTQLMNTPIQLPFDPYDFSKTEVGSVPIYYKNLPWAPCIHIYISFNTGAFHDPAGKEGLSHFLEHMIFDGSPSLPDRKATHEWRKTETLGSWNAYTSHYNTAYHLKCLPEKLESTLTLMKEQVFFPLLRDEDVEHERKVITQEAWGYFQNEKLLAYIREFTGKVFPGHSLSRVSSALGWPETVALIDAQDIRAWHKDNYHTGNMNIVITGNIDDTSIQLFKKIFKDIPAATQKSPLRENIPTPLLTEITKIADEIGLIKEQVEISISAFKDLPLFKREHEKAFGALLQDILHERLRDEKALCYGVHVSTRRSSDYINFGIDIKTSEEHIDVVKETIDAEIHTILRTENYKDRFEQVRKTNLEQLRAQEHDSDDIAQNATIELVRIQKIKTLGEALSNRETMTFEDMQNAGVYLFDKKYIVTEIVLPSRKD